MQFIIFHLTGTVMIMLADILSALSCFCAEEFGERPEPISMAAKWSHHHPLIELWRLNRISYNFDSMNISHLIKSP